MSDVSIHVPAPERVALAIDAMCTGTTVPLLVHAEHDPTVSPAAAPWALICTPLDELTSLAEVLAVLGAVSVPRGWGLVGLCAPTSITIPPATDGAPCRLDAWIIHVVTDSGAAASRLGVPAALEMSGPTGGIDVDHPLHRCLRRLVSR